MGSVFDDVPAAGTWATALLVDGNVGIGGNPSVLLRRLAEVLAPSGQVLCEVEPPGAGTGSTRLCLEVGGARSDTLSWATVSLDGAARLATGAGFALQEAWHADARWFARLTRRAGG